MSAPAPGFDFEVAVRKGTKRPVYGTATVTASGAVGTLTISAAPAPTFTLLDSTGAVVSGYPVTATGFDAAASAAVRVWHDVDTAGLAVGFYLGYFIFTVVGTDGITRKYYPEGLIRVVSTSTGVFTYDVTTDIGKARLLAGDIDPADYTFDDDEVIAFIALKTENLFVAAAAMVQAWAFQNMRLDPVIVASDGSRTQRRTAADLLLLLEKRLRETALNGGVIVDLISTASPNELLDSYWPDWRPLIGLPIVE